MRSASRSLARRRSFSRPSAYGVQAFTLLEISVVIVIISLLVGFILVFVSDMVNKRRLIDTKLRIDTIVKALENYREMNEHFPCPASRTVAQSNASFGMEVNSGTCTYTSAPAGTVRVETSGGSGVWVLIGTIPTKDLMLDNNLMLDGYGNRFSYIVMQGLTEDFSGEGALNVKDGGANDIITNGAFAVVSHGKDGKGAYLFSTGAATAACDASNLDKENCDDDYTLVDAPYNDGSTAASFFDDVIRWRSKLNYQ